MTIIADFGEAINNFLFGPKSGTQIFVKNNSGTLALRNAADSADAPLSSGAHTVSGILTTQSGEVQQQRVVTAAGAVTVTSADYMITVNKTVGAATTVNLPASPATGLTFIIHDGKGDAATNNITIVPNTGNINGAANLVLNIAYATATITYNGTQWDAQIGGAVNGLTVSTKSYNQRTILYDNTLGSAGTWDVSSIDQTYDHLEIVLQGMASAAAVSLNGAVAFNGDTTVANYQNEQLYGGNAAATGVITNGSNFAFVMAGSTSTANYFSSVFMTILNYTNAQNKSISTRADDVSNTTTGIVELQSMLWKNTAAINRIAITISNATNTFITGSRLQIIGVKAETVVTGVTATGTYGSNPYALAQGRLTPTSGTPILSSDVTGAGTIYWTPYGGDQIGLYNGSSWTTTQFTETSLSLTGLVQNTMYDIFGYSNAGTLALEALAWNTPATAAITGCTNASPPVLTSTNSLVVDDIITIFGVGGSTGVNGTFRVSAVSGTTITLNTLAGAALSAPGVYTSGGYWWKVNETTLTRATGLVYQNGILSKAGATTRRYLGTIRIQPTSVGAGGQTESSTARRFIYNHYNQILLTMFVLDNTSHTYSTGVYRPFNNNLANKVEFILGDSDTVFMSHHGNIQTQAAAAASGYQGISLDSITAVYNSFGYALVATTTGTIAVFGQTNASGDGLVGVGYHYSSALENCSGVNTVGYTRLAGQYLG